MPLPLKEGKGALAPSGSRFERIQKEQEGFRLALLGDAVSVAASAVFFAVRLVDATFDLFVSSALYSESLDLSQQAAEKYQTFLLFKRSEELRSMAVSLVLPLLLMRTLGTLKDVYFSACVHNGNHARKVLDVADGIALVITLVYSVWSIPPLEIMMGEVKTTGKIFDHAKVLDTFDKLEISHLFALAQAGLLMLISLLKLSARLERSSARILERANEIDTLESTLISQAKRQPEVVVERQVVKIETRYVESKTETVPAPTPPPLESVLDSDSSDASSTPKTPVREESPAQETSAAEPSPSQEEKTDLSMESEEFYRLRGWRRVPISPKASAHTGPVQIAHDDDQATAMDVLLGFGVGIATFVAVHKWYDPIVRLLKA